MDPTQSTTTQSGTTFTKVTSPESKMDSTSFTEATLPESEMDSTQSTMTGATLPPDQLYEDNVKTKPPPNSMSKRTGERSDNNLNSPGTLDTEDVMNLQSTQGTTPDQKHTMLQQQMYQR